MSANDESFSKIKIDPENIKKQILAEFIPLIKKQIELSIAMINKSIEFVNASTSPEDVDRASKSLFDFLHENLDFLERAVLLSSSDSNQE